ncbi:putative metallopeptidase M20 [Thermococcus cleftensis]|uniref:Metallopeptidase M20 n=1 Tax=Thermococcus cleftensis (strain DSM 27260 / KACC 17922 / CL1) TaxID=163003 RepID=I3ZUT0_THECF|nr:M20/M25/M40 family metallo-hydrolase [Thermococcus cleftensis]AFL95464.1 putative metallopeptidase M20 [Thermococcus cleftensis]
MEFDLLKGLVSISSPFGSEEEISRFIASFLEEHGFEVELLPVDGFGDNVIARLPGRGHTVVLNGHMDTVNLSSGWTRDPHGELDGDRFYGLGSADMKAGLAALMAAFVEVAELPKKERPNVIFTAVVDEEGYSRGAWELIRSGKLDKADVVLVGEPTNERLMLGARGRFVVQVEVFGRKAHAARPHEGLNAIEELGRFVGSLWKIRFRNHRKLGAGSYCTLHIEGSADGLSVPDYARAIIDRHIVIGEDWERVERELMKLAERIKLNGKLRVSKFERPTPDMLPYVVRENDRFVNVFKSAHRAVLGGEPEIIYGRSVGDFNYFGTYLGKPTLVYGPVGGNWHGSDEWVSVESMKRVKRVYVEFLKSLV